jgi:hypothetical protein
MTAVPIDTTQRSDQRIHQRTGGFRVGPSGKFDKRAINRTAQSGIYPTLPFLSVRRKSVTQVERHIDGIRQSPVSAVFHWYDGGKAGLKCVLTCRMGKGESAKLVDARVYSSLQNGGGKGGRCDGSPTAHLGASTAEQSRNFRQAHRAMPHR